MHISEHFFAIPLPNLCNTFLEVLAIFCILQEGNLWKTIAGIFLPFFKKQYQKTFNFKALSIYFNKSLCIIQVHACFQIHQMIGADLRPSSSWVTLLIPPMVVKWWAILPCRKISKSEWISRLKPSIKHLINCCFSRNIGNKTS